jgi:4-amino-4-deoxy-L-arabinose transferase-like glycosyltransferase
VLVFAFFSFSDSKLIPYILPILPPLALLTGRYLSLHWDNPSAAGLRAGTWTLLALGVVFTAVLVYAPDRMPDRPRVAEYSAEFGAYAWLILGSLLATAFIPFVVSLRRRTLWTVAALALTSIVFLVVFDRGVVLLDDKRSVKQLALDLKSRLRPGDEVMTYQEYYQDLPVYLGRTVTIVDWKGELEFGSEVEDTSGWMIDQATFWRRWNGPERAYMLTGRGNYDKLRAQEPDRFRLLAQTGSNVLLTNRAQ